MSRLHLHIAVDDLQQSITFYSALFGTEPTKVEADYAKWQLEDPKVNFAISNRSKITGVDHVGIQTETTEELTAIEQRLTNAGIKGVSQENSTCCYSESEKYWTIDPQGIPWETFHTLNSAKVFKLDSSLDNSNADSSTSCCAPSIPSSCC